MSYIIRWTTAGFAFGGAFIAAVSTSFAKITCQHSELGSELGHAEPQHNNSRYSWISYWPPAPNLQFGARNGAVLLVLPRARPRDR